MKNALKTAEIVKYTIVTTYHKTNSDVHVVAVVDLTLGMFISVTKKHPAMGEMKPP